MVWVERLAQEIVRVENLQMEQGNDCDNIVQKLSRTSTKTCQRLRECIERRMKMVDEDVGEIDKKLSDISRLEET